MVVPPSSSWKWTEHMQNIEDSSKLLREPYGTIGELVDRLDGLNSLLRGVDQQLSPAMELAVRFPMEALVANKLLMNDDINIKISLGCCICEVARITAPEPPYQDDIMREVCNLLITVLESLSFVTGNAYTKAALVLDNVARCQLFMAMWDCDDAFIVRMFQAFFHLCGTDHPNTVISNMKYIITLTVKEDADVPSDLFTIIRLSLLRENMNVYPVSYKLAEIVLQDCAIELKHSLQRAVVSDGDLQNYSEVVARVLTGAEKPVEDDSIGECRQSTGIPPKFNTNDEHYLTRTEGTMKNGVPMATSRCLENMQQGAVELNCASQNRDGKAVHCLESESSAPQKNGDPLKDTRDPIASKVAQEDLVSGQVSAFRKPSFTVKSIKHNSSSNTLHGCDQVREENEVDTSCSHGKDTDPANILFEESKTKEVSESKKLQEPGSTNSDVVPVVPESLDSQTVSSSSKRGRRPNSLLKPEEGYDDSWVQGGAGSLDVPRRRRNKRKEIGGPSEESISKKISSASPMAVETPLERNNQSTPNKRPSKKGNPRNADDILNENENLQVSTVSTIEAMRTASEREEVTCSDHNVEAANNGSMARNRDGSSEQIVVKKQGSGSSFDHIRKKSLLKRLASPETPEAPSEFDKFIGAIKENAKKIRARQEYVIALKAAIKDNAAKLVGHKIKVFWPLDERFYTGSVIDFDVLNKKYKVIYDDGDEEVLDLSSEQWEILEDDTSLDNLQDRGKVADVVLLPDSPNIEAGPSLPLTKQHKVLNDGGDHASSSNGQKQKVPKNRSTSKKLSSDVGGEHAATSTDEKKKVRKRRSKKEQVLEPEQTLNSNGQILEVLKNSSKLDQDQAIETINPATIKSPNSKPLGKTRSKSSQKKLGKSPITPSRKKLQKSPVTPSLSCFIQVGDGSSGTVNLHGYQVKSSTTPILSAIISKYGDIAANCLYKSPSFRASLLEVVCNVVQRLKSPAITSSDIQSMMSEISDAENAKIDVSWLQKYLVEITNEEETARKACGERMSTALVIGPAERDFKQRQAELVTAQTNFKNAEKRFEALKHVLGRIDAGILESVAKDKSWQRRLDELLSPK